MRENRFQKKLIKEIKAKWPEAIVVKNNSGYLQGIPDLTVNIGLFAFHLEVKQKGNAKHQPNQDWYVNHYIKTGGFAAFIYPENKEVILNAMEATLRAGREACISFSVPMLLAELLNRKGSSDISELKS